MLRLYAEATEETMHDAVEKAGLSGFSGGSLQAVRSPTGEQEPAQSNPHNRL